MSGAAAGRRAARRAVVGYTAGVFDVFNVGHLNLLASARAQCDHLVVGVSTDELCTEVKGVPPHIPLVERMAIVQSVRHVDAVVPQTTMDKIAAWDALRFDVLFVGDAALGSPYWVDVQNRLTVVGAAVAFLPATYVEGGALLDRRPEGQGPAQRSS